MLVVLLGYSYMKRVTRWSHLVLGLALGLAPAAAWIAVRGSLDPRILVLTAAVTLWVGGFDVLYACQDYEHDRLAGLHSLPQAIGIPAAFWAARFMHLAMLGLLAWFGWLFRFRPRWLARHRGRGTVAGLRALPGFSARSAPPECRILHHEWRHCHGLPGLCGHGSLAAEVNPDVPARNAQGSRCEAVVWCQRTCLAGRFQGLRSANMETGRLGTGMKVAIQGEPGSFSHEAAMKLDAEALIVPFSLSADVFAALSRGDVDAAAIPIENSLAGSVLEHFDLLLAHEVRVERETLLRIRHNLIALSGTTIRDIDRVFSHPVALAQCRRFLAAHPRMESFAFYDTAGSVKQLVELRDRHAAAIASEACRALLRGKHPAVQYRGQP